MKNQISNKKKDHHEVTAQEEPASYEYPIRESSRSQLFVVDDDESSNEYFVDKSLIHDIIPQMGGGNEPIHRLSKEEEEEDG